MTKPVQIQRYRQKGRVLVEDATSALMLYADHLDDKAATLLQVRSLLEAKAKEWRHDENKMKFKQIEPYRHGDTCADELEALAATLGNQGK